MEKSISLPKSNLSLHGSGHDKNGNKVVKVSFPNTNSFSIQTNANLRKTDSILRGLKSFKDMEKISDGDLSTISKEVCYYIRKYGSPAQKKRLKVYL